MNDVNPLQQKDIDYLKDGLKELKDTVAAGFVRLDNKLDSLDFYKKSEVDKEVLRLEGKIKEVEERIGNTETNISRVVWIVIAAVVIAVLGLLGFKNFV